jgi:metallophosphoesterase (TIGR00282 family)
VPTKKEAKILFIGDIIGEVGRDTVKKILPGIKSRYKVDFVIANGEHLSDRVGVDPEILFEMKEAGIDFFTSGNHVFRKKEFAGEINKKNMPIVRPANFISKYPGHGFRTVTTLFGKVLIINLLGKEGIHEKTINPFKKIDAILKSQKGYDFAILDFHAEMSSEKVAMGYHLDSRIAAVFGTHTHVATADQRIMPGGTAFVSDVGMCGPLNSVLGVKSDIIVERFLKGSAGKFELAGGEGVFNSVLITIKNKKAVDIKRIDKVVKNP